MKGWIKLHREVKDHWIWKDPVKFQWWLIMLLEVNFTPGKMMLGNRLVKVERGSSTNSLRRWAELFGCGTKATTNFFDLLESDEMISRKTLGKGKHSTTLINITNYEQYQTDKETLTDTQATTLTDTQGKRERHTIEEGKERKKNKKGEKRALPAFDFLKIEFPERFKTDFVDKFKEDFNGDQKEANKFKEAFNDQVESEGLKFSEEKLFPRLKKYARCWIDNLEKDKKEKQDKNKPYPIAAGAPERFDQGKLKRF